MISPPSWNKDELVHARDRAEQHFREARHTEPLESYLEIFDEYQGVVEEVMEETVDLTLVSEKTMGLWSDKRKREVFRYLTGPPVSEDDLKVLLETPSLAPVRLEEDPVLLERLAAFLRDWHDRRRFPWISEEWDPEEHDRSAAILATTALLAMRRLETMRRSEGKKIQEHLVATQLRRAQFDQVETRRVRTLGDAPKAGQFCRESPLGTRKADFIIGLWDGRTLALECKVSNSETNSIKRLNNDAAVKAETWVSDFGSLQLIAGAVLSGVYKVRNLEEAQDRGLTLFWAHDLQSLKDWLHQTKDRGLSTG